MCVCPQFAAQVEKAEERARIRQREVALPQAEQGISQMSDDALKHLMLLRWVVA